MDNMVDNRYGPGGLPGRHASHRGYSKVDGFVDGAGRRSAGHRVEGFDAKYCFDQGRGKDHYRRKLQRPSFEDEIEELYRVTTHGIVRRIIC